MKDTTAKGATLPAILNEIDAAYPGIRKYVLDEQGQLRKHVNIFIDGNLVKDRTLLNDPFRENSEIYIMQALSGG